VLFVLGWARLGDFASPAFLSVEDLAKLGLMFSGLGAVVWWFLNPSRRRAAVLISIVFLDLIVLGRSVAISERSPRIGDLAPPQNLVRYGDLVESSGQRLLPLGGLFASIDAGKPNVSRLWNIPNASGYNPLILSRYADFLGMTPNGAVAPRRLEESDRSLDMLGVRYVLAPRDGLTAETEVRHGLLWPLVELNERIGTGCGSDSPTRIDFPVSGVEARRIALVTSLACAETVPQGQPVLRVTLVDNDGEASGEAKILEAGVHTAEWAWERSDVRDIVAHEVGPIFEAFQSIDESGTPFDGYRYLSTFSIDRTESIDTIRLEWLGSNGELSLIKIVLENDQEVIFAVNLAVRFLVNSSRWTHAESVGSTAIYENYRALPRVWLASNVVALSGEVFLSTFRCGRFPDGRPFDPYESVLLEEPIDFQPVLPDPQRSTLVVDRRPGRVEVEATSAYGGFLILAETYYPGWVASVDGVPAQVVPSNFALQGLPLGSGTHNVVFEFRPMSFYAGVATSIVAVVLIVSLLLVKPRTKHLGAAL
jgi:hypothetical protein